MLADANELVGTLKRAALEAVEAGKPAGVHFGEVVGVSPLKINVEQKLVLSEKQLVLCRNVTDFTTEVAVDWQTENKSGGSGEASFASHNHAVRGRKKITVHNGLVVGDKVILLRQQKGQKFIVWDRIGT